MWYLSWLFDVCYEGHPWQQTPKSLFSPSPTFKPKPSFISTPKALQKDSDSESDDDYPYLPPTKKVAMEDSSSAAVISQQSKVIEELKSQLECLQKGDALYMHM